MVYPSWNIEESFRWLIRYVKYMIALAVVTGLTIPFIPSIGGAEKILAIMVIGGGIAIAIGLMGLANVGKYTLASRGFMVLLYLVITGVVFLIGGVKSLAVDIYYMLILSTGIFLDKRAHYIFLAVAILTVLGFWCAEFVGIYPSRIPGDIKDVAFVIVPIGVMCAVGAIGRRVVLLLIGKSEDLEQVVVERTKNLEEAIDLAERRKKLADKRTDQMESFLANMSHEMRTPLTSLLGGVDMLDKVPQDEVPETLDVVKNASRRLFKTFDSVLELNRLENSRGDLDTERVDVPSLIEEAINNLQDEGSEVKIRTSTEGGFADANEGALRRVLDNVIGNAIKYTPEGEIVVKEEIRGDELIVTVEDTGIGIESEFLPHVFEKYQQESSGYRRKYDGTGIGLYVARNLLTKMGGSIVVESEKGEGSTFTMTLRKHV